MRKKEKTGPEYISGTSFVFKAVVRKMELTSAKIEIEDRGKLRSY